MAKDGVKVGSLPFACDGKECVDGFGVAVYETVQEACDEIAEQDYDSVLVLGSIYLAGAVRKIIL